MSPLHVLQNSASISPFLTDLTILLFVMAAQIQVYYTTYAPAALYSTETLFICF
jgi:hypothetical protein